MYDNRVLYRHLGWYTGNGIIVKEEFIKWNKECLLNYKPRLSFLN